MKRAATASLLVALGVTFGCGGAPESSTPIVRETPEASILRVGTTWTSRERDNGFSQAPSRIRFFDGTTTSTVTFAPGARVAKEKVTVDETLKLDDGSTVRCQSGTTVDDAVRFGEHAGEAAVEVHRPALQLTRQCDAVGFPEPILQLSAAASRFALRGDQLVGFEPTGEKRVYLPGS